MSPDRSSKSGRYTRCGRKRYFHCLRDIAGKSGNRIAGTGKTGGFPGGTISVVPHRHACTEIGWPGFRPDAETDAQSAGSRKQVAAAVFPLSRNRRFSGLLASGAVRGTGRGGRVSFRVVPAWDRHAFSRLWKSRFTDWTIARPPFMKRNPGLRLYWAGKTGRQ